jgi:hypothetical protein
LTWARGEPDAWRRARPVRRCGSRKRTGREVGTAPRPDPYYVKAHEGPHLVSKAIVVATGVTRTGEREVLGLAVGLQKPGF